MTQLGAWRVAMQTLATLMVSFTLAACAGETEPTTDSVPTTDGLSQDDEPSTGGGSTSTPPTRETTTPSPNKGRPGIGPADDNHEEIKRPPE